MFFYLEIPGFGVQVVYFGHLDPGILNGLELNYCLSSGWCWEARQALPRLRRADERFAGDQDSLLLLPPVGASKLFE